VDEVLIDTKHRAGTVILNARTEVAGVGQKLSCALMETVYVCPSLPKVGVKQKVAFVNPPPEELMVKVAGGIIEAIALREILWLTASVTLIVVQKVSPTGRITLFITGITGEALPLQSIIIT
jgi:hypothetical protein